MNTYQYSVDAEDLYDTESESDLEDISISELDTLSDSNANSITLVAEDILNVTDGSLDIVLGSNDTLSVDGDSDFTDGITGWTGAQTNTSANMTFVNDTNNAIINIDITTVIIDPA